MSVDQFQAPDYYLLDDLLTEEHKLVRDACRDWVKREVSPIIEDAAQEAKFPKQLLSGLAEIGAFGPYIPEQYGGSDLGFLTFGVILEEIGRQLTASPLFASALVGASAVLLGGNDAQKQAVLPGIVDGSKILTLALEEGPRHAPENTALAAEKNGDGYKLTGAKTFVQEGMSATTYVVVARTSGARGDSSGLTLFLVDADASGLTRNQVRTVDSRGYANLDLDGVEVSADAVLGTLDEAYPVLEAVLDRARAASGAEMLGTAAQSFDMTLDYLKTREQFGQVIGSFQALGHRAAGLFGQMELARSCSEAALQAIDDDNNTQQMASLSKCRVGEFLYEMSNQLIQIHGGIGMTDEFNAGLYLKRARTLETAYGNRSYHRDRYATLSGF